MGRPVTQSSLGQSLNLLFPIRLNADETLGPDCVRAEVLAGDARVPASLVQLQLEGENESSVRSVRLQTSVQIDEPIVSINLIVGCQAQFTRQFTAFIDPPSVRALAASPPVDSGGGEMPSRGYSPALRAALATAEARPGALLAAPPPAALSLPALSAAPAASAAAPRKSPKPVKLAKAAKASRPATESLARANSAKPAASAPAPRLRLDPAEAVEMAASQAAASAADLDRASAELTAALARLQKLEDNLGRVQQDNRATQDKLLALRAQLEQAQAARYSNPLVLALGAVVLVLGGLVVFLWRSRRSEREVRESAWWNEVQNEQREQREPRDPRDSRMEAPAPAAPPSQAMSLETAASPTMPAPLTEPTMAGLLSEPDERTMVLPNLSFVEEPIGEPLSIQFVDPGAPVTMPAPISLNDAPDDEPPHVTVEELIDLEQQVDFFQVLGQDEAAIELLQSRVSTGVASALPYLKLLEIYQRRGEELAFTALTERFAERFKALPPTWGNDLNEGRQLEAYSRVLTRVQDSWSDSAASMALLQHLLSRGGEEAQGFDLPAYRDLLQLYGVARDLSEHEVRGDQIDLFLPLDGEGGGSGMMATMVWQSTPVASASNAIDLDLDLDDPTPTRR